MKKAPSPAFEASVLALLERVAVAVEGLREDLASGVAVRAKQSHGRDAVGTTKSAVDVPDPLRLLTVTDITKLFGIDARTLRQLRNAGDAPPAVLVGQRPRWMRSDVEQWISRRRAK